jgi:bis(5'-nucleosidyl)-tetraphosphatase
MEHVNDESYGIVPIAHREGGWKVFLILHRGGRHWGFPKGHKNPGEEPLDAAKRELFEETGLQVIEVLSTEPFVEQYKFRTRKQWITKTVSYFPARVTESFTLQKEEINDGKWLSFDEALALLTFKEGREICKQAMALLKHDIS